MLFSMNSSGVKKLSVGTADNPIEFRTVYVQSVVTTVRLMNVVAVST